MRSVECLRSTSRNDVCNLTIAPLIESDGGTYQCQYYNAYYQQRYYFDSVQLNVSYGNLPSDESPICETFKKDAIGGGYEYKPTNTYVAGDEVYLRCRVEDSSISSLIYWTREQQTNTTVLTPSAKGKRLGTDLMILTEKDVGAIFICVMAHPALLETRNCSITPLPILDVPTNVPETRIPNFTPSTIDYLQTTSQSNASLNRQSYFLPVIIVVVISVVFITIVIVVLMMFLSKRRRNQNARPNQPAGRKVISNSTRRGQPDVEHDLNATNYTGLNLSETKTTYEELKEKGATTDNCPIATPSIIASYLALFNILCIEKHLKS